MTIIRQALEETISIMAMVISRITKIKDIITITTEDTSSKIWDIISKTHTCNTIKTTRCTTISSSNLILLFQIIRAIRVIIILITITEISLAITTKVAIKIKLSMETSKPLAPSNNTRKSKVTQVTKDCK